MGGIAMVAPAEDVITTTDDLVTPTGTATTTHAVTTIMGIPVIVIDTTTTAIPTIIMESLAIIEDPMQGSILVGKGEKHTDSD